MTERVSQCPGCGAEIRFANAATLFVVCSFCKSASRRVGLDLERIGRVSDIVPIRSDVRIGTTGRFEDVPFVVVGLLQLDHGAGPWNEWCLSFGDGRWAWLAEAQGELLVTRSVESAAPAHGALSLGDRLRIAGAGEFVISEIGKGRVVAALGEIPVEALPGREFRYADLRGEGGAFATFDYGEITEEESPECEAVYCGRKVALGDLHLDAGTVPMDEPARAESRRIECPNCGASHDLKNPERTRRLGCASCGAVLDPTGDVVALLEVQEQLAAKPKIPLGARGTIERRSYETIAFLERSVRSEGVRYPWTEYLLLRDDGEYRWLVCSSGHWSFVEPVNPAEVQQRATALGWRGRTYKHFAGGRARTDLVLGELYWEVQVGEEVLTQDFIAPPDALSLERSEGEVHYSHGVYLEPSAVQKAFGLSRPLPAPSGVGMQQPNPYTAWSRPFVKAFGLLAALLLVVVVLLQVRAERKVVFETTRTYSPPAASAVPAVPQGEPQGESPKEVIFSEEFDLADGNVEAALSAGQLVNQWFGVDGALVNVETGVVHSWYLEADSWSGVEGGESWQEGDSSPSVYLGPIEAGRYALRLEPSAAAGVPEIPYRVRVRSGVPSAGRPLLVALGLLLGPVVALLASAFFESARWSQSDHA
ncbi:MAG: DUF4178 domain-containing protein [Planctomycetes bacterium]|nr:DUF4178 domain-containing protein [Planctomycetota bacterium]